MTPTSASPLYQYLTGESTLVAPKRQLVGELAAGYRQIYWQLAILAIVGAAATALLRPPRACIR